MKTPTFHQIKGCRNASALRMVSVLAFLLSGQGAVRSASLESKLYFMSHFDTVVRRSNPDGSELEELYRTPGGGGNYVTVDPETDRIYFPSTEAGGIQTSSLDGESVSLRIGVDKRVATLGVHAPSHALFWSDSDDAIWRYDLTDDSRSMIIDDELSIVTAIVPDPQRDYFYWAERGIGRIMRTTVDGAVTTTLVGRGPFGDYPSPTGLALDATRGTLYCSDMYFSAILQVNIDGTRPAVFATDGVIYPTAVAFDEVGQRIYWANGDLGSGQDSPYERFIMSAKLDGTDLRPEFIPRNQWGAEIRVTQMTIAQIPVPEPSGFGLIVVSAIGCLRRSAICGKK
jgi:DNA-binding beta-propeller fold protein YncE